MKKRFRSLAFFLLFVTVLSLHPLASSFDEKDYRISAKEDVKEFLNQCLSDHDRAVLEHFDDEKNPYIKMYPVRTDTLLDFFQIFTKKEGLTVEELRKEAENSLYLTSFARGAYFSQIQSEEPLPQPNLQNAVVHRFHDIIAHGPNYPSEPDSIGLYGNIYGSAIDYYTLTPEGRCIIAAQRVAQDGVTHLWQLNTPAYNLQYRIDKETGEISEVWKENSRRWEAHFAKEILSGDKFYTDEAGVLCLRKNSSPLKDMVCFWSLVFYETEAGIIIENAVGRHYWLTLEEFKDRMEMYQTHLQWAEFFDIVILGFPYYLEQDRAGAVQRTLISFKNGRPATFYTILTVGILLIVLVITVPIVLVVRHRRKKRTQPPAKAPAPPTPSPGETP